MKQRVTPAQLESLSEVVQERLAAWFGKQNDQAAFVPTSIRMRLKQDTRVVLPLLTIGEMLQFLTEHQLMGYFILTQSPYKAISLAFRVEETKVKEPPVELCDVLFEAVREALEQQTQG